MATHPPPVATGQPWAPPSPKLAATIAANLSAVRSRIARAARTAGRNPEDIRLVAISKTFGIEHVRAAVAAGQTEFGENRVQEALQKIAVSTELEITWHFVGHLQSNKASKAVAPFAWIHTVDSLDLLRRLDSAACDQGTAPNLLVQVDLAGEVTKHGASRDAVREIVDSATACRAARVCGLMLLPPLAEAPEQARPYFRRLRELRDALLDASGDPSILPHLSMGMSHDLEVAIEEGATMVRVGTALFGQRPRVERARGIVHVE